MENQCEECDKEAVMLVERVHIITDLRTRQRVVLPRDTSYEYDLMSDYLCEDCGKEFMMFLED